MQRTDNRVSSSVRMAGIVLMSLVLMTAPAHAGFLGHEVDADYRFPSIDTIFDGMSTQPVGAGIEFSLFLISIDLDDTHIRFSRSFGTIFQDSAFNGFSFFDASGTIAPIVGVHVASTSLDLTDARITFDADHIYVNFGGLQDLSGFFETTLVVTFQGSQGVPEPSTLMLVALAVCLLAFAHRRKRR